MYLIPSDTEKPIDKRKLPKKRESDEFAQLFLEIDTKAQKLNDLRPLTSGETARLRNEFIVEFTYNSNAIEGNTLTIKETALEILR